MKWGIYLILGLLLVSAVNALNFGEVFGETGPMTVMEQDGTVKELTCVEVKQLVLDETGWDQIYCADNETTELIFIQGNFTYGGHHKNNNGADEPPSEVPEFGVIAGMIGLFGAGLIFATKRGE